MNKNIGESDWYQGMLCEFQGQSADAIRHYKRAARLGYVPAYRRLGQFYYDGAGVPKDDARAFAYFACAAEQGDAYAQFSLGVLYSLGLGTAQDPAQSVRWLEKAAAQGHTQAIFYLAMAYYRGEGVPANMEKAMELIRQAARLGHHEAQYFLYLEDKTQISLLTQAAQGGNSYAQMDLGTYYDAQGQPEKAVLWYEKSAETVVEGRLALATYYLDGTLPQNTEKAIEYLKGCVFQKPGDQTANENTRAYAIELLAFAYRLQNNQEAVVALANMYAQEFNVPVQDVLDNWSRKTYE